MGTENRLRWDCDERGCFNKKKRPKIEQFAHCFPGRIQMGDVDGMVEVNGHFLFIEWKPSAGDVSIGQTLAYKRLSGLGSHIHTVFVVAGDAEEMRVDAVQMFINGEVTPWLTKNKEELFASVKNWVAFVSARARPRCQNCAEVTS